ncbi:MAG: zinc dependent phospholipase C family protein [Sediminibacterium sp.]|nr:zinc dependent phospholipase C family protein [Sediminibacterium sp.]
MQLFFYNNKDYLVYNSVRPDLRRKTDRTEATKHFIDLEIYENQQTNLHLPLQLSDAIKMYPLDSLKKYGYVPYYIIIMMRHLENAFHIKNKDSILFYAADIGHYIADANVPLHTTINYDGQLTKQKGLHALWESTLPALGLKDFDLFSNHTATFLSHPEKNIWDNVRQAHADLNFIIQTEQTVSTNFTPETKYRVTKRKGKEYKTYSTNFAKAYLEKIKPNIVTRMQASINLTADIWFTCWVNAGKPNLVPLLNEPQQKLEQKLAEDLQYFNNNELIKKNRLQALSKNKIKET